MSASRDPEDDRDDAELGSLDPEDQEVFVVRWFRRRFVTANDARVLLDPPDGPSDRPFGALNVLEERFGDVVEAEVLTTAAELLEPDGSKTPLPSGRAAGMAHVPGSGKVRKLPIGV